MSERTRTKEDPGSSYTVPIVEQKKSVTNLIINSSGNRHRTMCFIHFLGIGRNYDAKYLTSHGYFVKKRDYERVDKNGSYLEWIQRYFSEDLEAAIAFFADKGLQNPPASVRCATSTGSSTITDISTSGFKKISRNGGIVNNPMRKHGIEIQIDAGEPGEPSYSDKTVYDHADRQQRNFWYRTERTWAPSVPFGAPGIYRAIGEIVSQSHYLMPTQNAVNSAYGNINVGDLQALVFAGEGRETISHLTTVLSRFTKIAKAIRTGRWHTIAPKTYRKWRQGNTQGKTMSIYNLIEEAWMEARYAWRPLIMDANAAINLLKGQRSLTPRQTFRGKDETSDSTSGNTSVSVHGFDFEIEYTASSTSQARAGVLCEARSSIGLGQELGLFNVVDAAVELIPYSFIFQWFVNIGGLLNSLRPSGSYDVIASWETQVSNASCSGMIHARQDGNLIKSVPFLANSDVRNRETGATSTLFSIDLNIDLYKIADLTAILRGLLSK